MGNIGGVKRPAAASGFPGGCGDEGDPLPPEMSGGLHDSIKPRSVSQQRSWLVGGRHASSGSHACVGFGGSAVR